jgi:hypothetical protein
MLKHAAVLIVLIATFATSAYARSLGSDVALEPKLVNFGHVALGDASVAELTVRNRRATSMLLGPVGITDRNSEGAALAFGLSGGTCFSDSEIVALEPEASCTIGVTFEPQAPGVFKADLLIAIDTFASELSVKLLGSARG